LHNDLQQNDFLCAVAQFNHLEVKSMKKFGFIVIIVFLLFPAQVMARWTVTHLSPGNLDYPSKSFNIQIEKMIPSYVLL